MKEGIVITGISNWAMLDILLVALIIIAMVRLIL